ncbi:FUSC family protein [Alicyclobacillus fastidiosus]|uniref:FUSC family protein n=1 Tax=Alicyclobacillus fastidiosus TaxID=392011 RepID=A0ABY6ZF47_9BACL|nr:FUSC family protein [Alicyclobacillus fastidiosus]WAH41350.1 FUSC family protein [Alicyclobacillus fastidiosus]GMA62960.1 hypothetical protein GCM10025859_34000 [Alicyclobacillus fastidiosus]
MNNHANQGMIIFLEQSAIIWKMALGSAIVWELARLTGSKHPYLGPLTFILCLQATVGQSLRFALYRSLGTVIGVLLMDLFAKSLPVTAWSLALALLVSTALMKLFRANDLLIHQVALSILFVLYFENHSSGYAWDRAKDTLIGAAVSVVFILFLFPPNTLKKTQQAIDKVVQNLVGTANLVADLLQKNLPNTIRNTAGKLNALLDDVDQITESLKNVEQGAPFLVYVRRADLDKLTNRCHRLRDGCIHFVTLVRTFTDNMNQMERVQWSNRVRSLATEVPAYIYDDSSSESDAVSMPSTASNSPIVAFQPDVSEHELKEIINALRGFTDRSKV